MNWVILAGIVLALVLSITGLFEHRAAFDKCIEAGYVYMHGQCLDVKQIKLP